MATLKRYNDTTGQWEYLAVGPKGADGVNGAKGDRGPIGVAVEAIIQSGNLIVKNNVMPPGQRIPANSTITNVYYRLGTAPTGQDARVRVMRNRSGTTTQLAEHSITAGTNSASYAVSWAVQAGDVITYDVVQTGTTVIGADLAVQLVGTGG